MASVYNRGTKDRPKWFARYKDSAGIWRSRLSHQPTRALATRVSFELQARAERLRLGIDREPVAPSPLLGPLLERWSMSLVNRSCRGDIGRMRLHVLPRFASLRIEEMTLAYLLHWLEEERTAARVTPQTLRHLLALLSRFFNWAVGLDLAQVNPVRNLPASRRPQQPERGLVPWLENDAMVATIMDTLPPPFSLMFFIGNRSAARVGEICGLRLSDLATLAQGSIRIRFSYTGPLKEDRRGTGKMKWAPAPADAVAVLGPWIARRRAEEAGDESFLFERPIGGPYRKEALEAAWNRARTTLGLGSMTFYQATRHTAASRWLSTGVPLDQVAAALGHSTPAVTAKHYAHFIRRTFAPGMLAPIDRPDGPIPLVLVAA